jgi:hypothetical protein
MKELFGQRPEPWIELTVERQPAAVTVTSEPIPAMITVAPNKSMEAQLAGVRDLSRVGVLPASTMTPTLLPIARPVMRLEASAELATVPAPPPAPRSQLALLITGVVAAAIVASIVMYFVMRQKPVAAIPAAVTPIDAPRVVAVAPPADGAIDARPPIDAFVPMDASVDAPDAKPADEILAALAAERYAEVVDRCLAAPSIADHGAACTLAACHVHKIVDAKRWFSRVSNQRRSLVITTCRGLGVQVGA